MTEHDSLHVPDVMVEQYRLGELPPDQADRVERLSRLDEGLRRRIEALDRSDEEIARQYPPAWMAGAIRARLQQGSTGWTTNAVRRRRFSLAMAAAAIVLVFAVSRELVAPQGIFGVKPEGPAAGGGGPAVAPRGDATGGAGADRIKGLRPALAMYRQTARGSETLADGTVARRGDLVRVGYASGRRAYGVILSIDGRGAVTIHLPPDGRRAAPLKSQATVLLDQAYELDDAPNWERFYFITGHTAFDVGPVVEAARRAAAAEPRTPPRALALPGGLDQTTFSLQKEARP